jgi:hypothetical protein
MKKILYFIIILSMSGVYAQNWQAIDNGLSGAVRSLFPDTINDQLMVGGEFYYLNGNLQKSIAVWNDTILRPGGNFQCNPLFAVGSWHRNVQGNMSPYICATDCNTMYCRSLSAVNTPWLPIDSDFSGTVFCYAQKNSTLYVGGGFNTVAGVAGGGLAYWSDHRQCFVDIALPYPYGMVSDIAFLHDTMYIVASFPDTSGISVSKVLRRTCSCRGWIDITPYLRPGYSWASSLENFQGELYLAGNFRKSDGSIGNSIMRYDGTSWNDVADGILHSGSYGQVFSLHAHEDLLYVGGLFEFVGNTQASNIAAWNGVRWCSLGNGEFNNTILSITTLNDELFVGGRFTAIDGVATKYIAKYTGNLSSICHPIFTGSSAHE